MAVVDALAAHCTKAIFFPIGKHATYEPGILKQVAAAGHAIGSHTWSHQDLSKKSVEEAKDEIEKGISAVAMAVGGPTAPYFRFPALRHPPELVTYLGQRNVAIFSTDFEFLRLQDAQARAGPTGGDGEVEETRQRHCADARFPASDTRRLPTI